MNENTRVVLVYLFCQCKLIFIFKPPFATGIYVVLLLFAPQKKKLPFDTKWIFYHPKLIELDKIIIKKIKIYKKAESPKRTLLQLVAYVFYAFSGISSIWGVMVISFNFHLSLFALIPKKRGCAKSTSIVSLDVVI